MRKAEHMRILVAFGALSQVGGEAFGDSGANRSSIARVWHLLAGGMRWPRGNPREVDADVRIGDRASSTWRALPRLRRHAGVSSRVG